MTFEEQKFEEYARERERNEIIKTKIHFSWEELTEMSESDRIKAILQMKQDETMKWQRLSSQLYYYLTIVSLIIIGLAFFVILINKN